LQPHPRAEAHRNKIFAYIEKLIKHVARKELGACELVLLYAELVCACMCDEGKRLCVFASVLCAVFKLESAFAGRQA
jgi:hypothetical protein